MASEAFPWSAWHLRSFIYRVMMQNQAKKKIRQYVNQRVHQTLETRTCFLEKAAHPITSFVIASEKGL